MPRSRFTKYQIEEMRTLYKEGVSSVNIGKQYGCKHSTVLYHIGGRKIKAKRIKTFRDGNFLVEPRPYIKPLSTRYRPRPIKPTMGMERFQKGYFDYVRDAYSMKPLRDRKGNIIAIKNTPLDKLTFKKLTMSSMVANGYEPNSRLRQYTKGNGISKKTTARSRPRPSGKRPSSSPK